VSSQKHPPSGGVSADRWRSQHSCSFHHVFGGKLHGFAFPSIQSSYFRDPPTHTRALHVCATLRLIVLPNIRAEPERLEREPAPHLRGVRERDVPRRAGLLRLPLLAAQQERAAQRGAALEPGPRRQHGAMAPGAIGDGAVQPAAAYAEPTGGPHACTHAHLAAGSVAVLGEGSSLSPGKRLHHQRSSRVPLNSAFLDRGVLHRTHAVARC
jgi:hypothetical protein